MKKLFLFFSILLILDFVSALSLSGSPMPADVFYEQGTQREFTYRFGTASHTQDYRIDLYTKAEYDVTKLITVEPNFFKQVPPGSGAEFKVKLNFDDENPLPGRHDALVIVKETETATGAQIGALAQAAVRFRITVLYPTEYLNWDVKVDNANVGDDINLIASITNWGVPPVTDAVVHYKVYDGESNLVREAQSEVMAVDSKESASSTTSISSEGLLPDDYLVRARITYAGEESSREKTFRLGTKNVIINSITNQFVPEAINVVEVNIESGWNDDIDQIKGIVQILDGSELLNSFVLEETSLQKWRSGLMKGYFESFGIPKGDYEAKVTLTYEDASSTKTFDIVISDEGTAKVTDQNPNGFSRHLSVQNFIFVALIIILGMNVWYLMDRRKR